MIATAKGRARPPAPGIDATLGQCLDYDVAIAVECPGCRHHGAHDPSPLAQRYGYARQVRTLRWLCSRCGARGVPTGILPMAGVLPATARVTEALVA